MDSPPRLYIQLGVLSGDWEYQQVIPNAAWQALDTTDLVLACLCRDEGRPMLLFQDSKPQR
jgi:hypothetical protein